MNLHKTQTLLAAAALSTTALLAAPADAELIVAGWDTFTAEPESDSPPTHFDADTTATMAAGAGGGWNDWNNGVQGASDDGTFGNLSTSVASATTFVGTSSNQNTNLSLNRSQKPGSLVFTLVNNSGSDRNFEAFYFDGGYRFTQSARNWELSFGDAIAGSSASGSLAQVSALKAASAADRDWKIDLTGLSDNVWEAGSTATFTLNFTGGGSPTGTGGGHETLIDNIAITIVPEPGSLALLGLGGLLIARRRKA